ncbi:MAG: TetR/AcrR family transcriptional regulator [Lachnospiraceae bacterium]|nr:TetR/AcrR family transcriptional regulator [Lachnospiraceae bacterium]
MADKYHHENLRQELIDTGIRIINEVGEENLSLRGVASACNVSHSAPYAHFKDKEELLDAIKTSVTKRFTEELKTACEGAANADEGLIAMGKAYIAFFHRNPDYYAFLFNKQKIVAHLQPDKKHVDDYPPFLLFKELYKKHLKENNIKKSKKEQEIDLIKIWGIVHGMASLACMKGVDTSIDWEDPSNTLVI